MTITRKHLVLAGAGIALIAAIAYLSRPKPLRVDVARVERTDLESTIEAEGFTRVRERFQVVAPVTGRLERITFTEGERVRAGDVVARIGPLPLDAQTTAQVHARVEAAVALALQAEAHVRVANAELTQRRREYSRALRLAEVGGIAPRAVEECMLAQLTAEEGVRTATQRAAAAEADVRQARAMLAGERPGDAARIVRAPASGTVLRLAERSERIVTAGAPIMEIGDPAAIEVVADVLSSDATNVRPGQPVRLSGWNGAGMTVIGKVVRTEPAGYAKVSALGLVEQRVNVIIDPGRLPPEIGDGYRVETSIVTWRKSDVLTVPRSALFQDTWMSGDTPQWMVFAIRSGRVEQRLVDVGHMGGGRAEIASGLSPGDEIVAYPSDRVKVGIRVAPR